MFGRSLAAILSTAHSTTHNVYEKQDLPCTIPLFLVTVTTFIAYYIGSVLSISIPCRFFTNYWYIYIVGIVAVFTVLFITHTM